MTHLFASCRPARPRLLSVLLSVLLAVLLAASLPFAARAQTNVGVGTTTPHASSALDVSSTTKGFLAPRLTQTQRDAIGAPAAGLTIYNTTTNRLNVWNGTAWTEVLATPNATQTFAPVTFSFTGAAQTYTVPPGVTSLRVTALGSMGSPYNNGSVGGSGGRAEGTLAVTPGEVLTVIVGGRGAVWTGGSFQAGGFNGGGNSPARFGSGGGGASSNANGGAGGSPGLSGDNFATATGGEGGTATGGGAGGTGDWTGQAGALGQGGEAGTTGYASGDNSAGGGGGGYYGGGGGGLASGGSFSGRVRGRPRAFCRAAELPSSLLPLRPVG